MKPVVVITVYRRYCELARNLRRLRELSTELSESPDVVVVWAQPELGRLWFFQQLMRDGAVQKLLTRQVLPGESSTGSTTYPESHNIRLGLDWVRANYDPATTYAIVMAADVELNPVHALKFIDTHMSFDEGRAVAFHWVNGCVPYQIWHTNCFAVCLDERYWPPVLPIDSSDTLEGAWGKSLASQRLHGVLESHNSREKRFVHRHLSEGEPEWPVLGQEAPPASTSLLICGYVPWWRRCLQKLRLIKPFTRPAE